MKRVILLITVFILSGCAVKNDIEKSIDVYFEGYRLVDWRDYNEYCGSDKKPGFISADFNGDGFIDRAILIRKEEKDTVEKIYAVFFGGKTNLVKPVILDRFAGRKTSVESKFIGLLKPGTYKIIDRNIRNRVPIDIPYHGIRGGTCESAACIWYWDKQKTSLFRCGHRIRFCEDAAFAFALRASADRCCVSTKAASYCWRQSKLSFYKSVVRGRPFDFVKIASDKCTGLMRLRMQNKLIMPVFRL